MSATDPYLRDLVDAAYSALNRFRHDNAREPQRFSISADAYSAIIEYLDAQTEGLFVSRGPQDKIAAGDVRPLTLCGIPVEASSDLENAEVRAS